MSVGTGWSVCRSWLTTGEALPDGVPQPGANLVSQRLKFGARESGVARAGVHVVREDPHGPRKLRDVLRVELHGDKDAQRVRICNGLDDTIRSDSYGTQARGQVTHDLF